VQLSNAKIAHELLRPVSPRDMFLLSVYTTLWGLQIANPFVDTFAKSHVYINMASLLPEPVWGIMAILVSIFLTVAVHRGCWKTLMWASRVGFILWGTIFLFYITVDISSTGWITAATISSFYLIIAINASVNKKNSIATSLS
jgi:hypothetical protein